MSGTEHRKSVVKFSYEQIKYLEELFPEVVFPWNATQEQLTYYMGQRSVLKAVKEKAYSAETHITVLPTR